MTARTLPARIPVEIFVDPVCPFAWSTATWLFDVERHGLATVTIRLMSIYLLNATRDDIAAPDRETLHQAHRAGRVGTAIERQCGSGAVRAFYEAFGVRRHLGGEPLDDELIAAALRVADLEPGFLAYADDTDADAMLEQSHRTALAELGPGVGTPILRMTPTPGRAPTSMFGPVLTATTTDGPQALKLWEAVTTLVATPGFRELKR